MTSTIQKWGNSLALRIPYMIAKDCNIREGTEVKLSLDDGNIIISPKSRRKLSLTQLLRKVTKGNLHAKHSAGDSAGREIL
jgi:antitoxin MazE